MHKRNIVSLVPAFLLLIFCAEFLPLAAQQSGSATEHRKLLAIFAHPDDETMAGALLAHYAHEKGTGVYLAIVSNGEKGVMPHTRYSPGEELERVRIKEAECATHTLGIHAPILLGMPDGGLNNVRVLAELAAKLKKTIAEVNPDAIVTWGPDGGYGHADHRLVSAVVTQIVQEMGKPRLFYAALPKSRMPESTSELRFPAPFVATSDQYLDTRVRVSRDDETLARKSLACHQSQFRPESMERISDLTEKVDSGVAYLRSWSGGKKRTDLFR